MNPVIFPTKAIPSIASDARLLGLYPQRQPEKWMQRIRIPGGRLNSNQWQTLAEIAERFTPGTPLHLTTRQDLELHDVTANAVADIQSLLASVNLTTVGACGDTIRNVTVCPCSGVAVHAPDLHPLAQQITDLLTAQKDSFQLPRKFKISLSACPEGCGLPWINDLGFWAVRTNDQWKIKLIVAGSLGSRPATGIDFSRLLDPGEVPPLALAAVRIFLAYGDREHRYSARLRHVRERFGNESFLDLLNQDFDKALKEKTWPIITLSEPTSGFAYSQRLHFPYGNLSPEIVKLLGTLAANDNLCIRIANYHEIWIWGRTETQIQELIEKGDLKRFQSRGPRLVACPGIAQCTRGLANTTELAAAIHRQLAHFNVGDLLIGISGCPNGCAHSAVADIGVVGVAAGSKHDRHSAWNVLAHGQRGQGPGLAQVVASRKTFEEAVNQIKQLVITIAEGQMGANGEDNA